MQVGYTVLTLLRLIPDFDQDGVADNISFMIKRIKVHTSEAAKDPGYRFPGNYGVEKFLELFSGQLSKFVKQAISSLYRSFGSGNSSLPMKPLPTKQVLKNCRKRLELLLCLALGNVDTSLTFYRKKRFLASIVWRQCGQCLMFLPLPS